jgi:hypothetical protein
VWIPLLGLLLAGIVAMQVEVLKLNAGIGRSLERGSALQGQNELLRASVARLSDEQRIERLAAQMGMAMPAPTQLRFVRRGPASVERALGSIHAPDATSFIAQLPPVGAPAAPQGTANTGVGLAPAGTASTTSSASTTAASGTSGTGSSAGTTGPATGTGDTGTSTSTSTGTATGTSGTTADPTGAAGTSGTAGTSPVTSTAPTTSAGATDQSGSSSSGGVGATPVGG